MGGIGKTTIAKSLYNKLYHNFEARCFLANIKDISSQPNGLVRLQEQLLSSIATSTKIKLDNVHQGIAMLQERLRHKKILLILDDADKIKQTDTLAISPEWFASGSRVIITTRDQHLLNQLKVDGICSVDEMVETEALELLSWHAFRNSYPSETYLQLSRSVVNYSGGLPLALEVLGCFLFGRSELEWEDTLKKLKRIPEDGIQKKLWISFDGLDDDTKDIFLDVCCFFIGMDKDYVVQVLDGCDFSPIIGIRVLLERRLLKIGDSNKLMMHDLLRDMGREIVREQFPKQPESRTRLFVHEEVLSVLAGQKGTGATEGIALKLPRFNEEKLSTEGFKEMQNLRLLQLNFVNLSGDFKHISKELRWLCWHGFPLKFLPKDFCMDKLVAIDLRYSQISFFSKDSKFLENLKYLNLSHSHYLTHTPNFSKMPKLENLKLEDCKNLVELDPTIEELKSLSYINLKDCISLKFLPKGFSKLKSLKTVLLSGCSKLTTLPQDLGELESLKILIADETAIKHVPPTIVKLKNLKYLSLCGCKGPPSKSLIPSIFWSWISPIKQSTSNSIVLPSSFQSWPNSLTTLCLDNCNLSNDAIPEDIGSLVSLKELDLSENLFHSLPSTISGLLKLNLLVLNSCAELRCIPELPPHLRMLCASHCTSLERTSDFLNVKDLSVLIMVDCPKLVDIPGLENFLDIIVINMEGCSNINNLLVKETILQGGAESGYVYEFCEPGNEIPDSFDYKNEGNQICFEVPNSTNWNLEGFLLCIVYSSCVHNNTTMSTEHLSTLEVINSTKQTFRIQERLTKDLVMSIDDHFWIGMLSNKTFRFRPGDIGKITVKFEKDQITVKKIGIFMFDEYRYSEMLEFGWTSKEDGVVVVVEQD